MTHAPKFDDTPGDLTELQRLRKAHSTISDWMRKFRRVDRKHDVPYLGGISNDGATVYIDKHLPKALDGIPLEQLFIAHETVEHALVKGLKYKYERAHHLGTAAEQRALAHVAPGKTWADYTGALRPYYKPIEHEKIEDPPDDLALYPYSGHLYKTLWEHQQGKVSKASVNYRVAESPEKRRCGNCSMFRQASHSCTLVIGHISASDVCDKWEAKTSKSA